MGVRPGLKTPSPRFGRLSCDRTREARHGTQVIPECGDKLSDSSATGAGNPVRSKISRETDGPAEPSDSGSILIAVILSRGSWSVRRTREGQGEDPGNGVGSEPAEYPAGRGTAAIPAVALLLAEAHQSGSAREAARAAPGRDRRPCGARRIVGPTPTGERDTR